MDLEHAALDALDGHALAHQRLGQAGRLRRAHAHGGSLGGLGHDLGHRRVGDQPAAPDDDEVLGRDGDLAHQVRRQEDGAPAGRQALEEVADPEDPLGVEPVGRLVEDHHRRVAEQRRGDPEPLPHAQREAADPLAGHVVEAHERDHLVDARARDAVRLGHRAEVVEGAAAGVDGARLEHRADLVQRRLELVVAAPVGANRAGGRRIEPHDHAHGRRLAGAVGAEEAGDDARLHGEREVVDGQLLPVALAQVLDLDHVLIIGVPGRTRDKDAPCLS